MGPSGGPITKDNTSVEYYGTIFAVAESPHESGRALGRLRRRPGPRLARRREDLEERHAASGAAGVDHDRTASRPARSRRAAYVAGTRVQVRRLPAVSLQDHRLRRDLDEDHQRHRRRSLHARRPRRQAARACSTPAPSAGCTSRSTTARLAVAAAQPADRADHRPRRARRRPDRRHPGPLVLDARRPHAAAPAGAARRGEARASLRAARRLAHGRLARRRRRRRERARTRRRASS